MSNLYWIGLNESEIEFSKNLFKKSITINGSGINNNISFSNKYKIRKNYSVDFIDIISFYSKELERICLEDPKARFMFYSPYTAYSLGKKVLQRTICLNSYELLSKIKSKFKMREWIKQTNTAKLLPYVFLDGKNINYSSLLACFPNNTSGFVVQKEISDGGNGTILLNCKNDKCIDFDENTLYCVSEYIPNSISINSTLIIYDNNICFLPSSIQIVSNNKNLSYKGADFISYKDLPNIIKKKIKKTSQNIGELLQQKGYRGICGIDYIYDGTEVYFMEINERFQASTYLINMALFNSNRQSVQEMCIDAFESNSIGNPLIDINVNYSNYAYSLDSNKSLLHILDRIPYEKSIEKVVYDGFSKDLKIEKNAYLFKLVFSRNISGITPDNSLKTFDCITGIDNIDIQSKIDIKIALMCCGVYITQTAQNQLIKCGGVCKSISEGINITIFDNMTVGCFSQTIPMVALSPFTLDFKNDDFVLLYYDQNISKVKMQTQLEIMKNKTKNGVPFSDIAILALDRVTINYCSQCRFKKENIACGFCGVSSKPDFELEDIYEVIDSYLNNVDFNHFLIGGPVNIPSLDLKKINAIARYISSKCDKPIYLMTLPITQNKDLTQLKENGITEIAFNIEIFDRSTAKKIMPGKGGIPISKYNEALKNAKTVWKKPGTVRSMLVVGLEKRTSFLEGIESLAKTGVSPILSPFGPAKNSTMEKEIPASFSYLRDIYFESNSICEKHNVHLGPTCDLCKNNVLSFN